MGTKFRIARNILANWGGLAFSTLISFLLAPYILHKLGDAGYGVWMLTISLTGYLGLLDLGIRSSVVRFVAKYKASSDYASLNQVVNTALVAFSLAGLLSLLLGSILGVAADSVFNIPHSLENQATWVIIIISATLAFSFGTSVFASTLVGIERFDLLNLATILATLLRAGLILLVFPVKANLVCLGVLTLVSSLVSCVLIVYFALRHIPELKINLRLSQSRTLKRIFDYGIFSFLIIVATRVSYYSDNTVIGIFGSAEQITYFAIGAISVEMLRRVVNSLTSVIMPLASGLESRGSQESLQRLLTIGTKYSFLLILPMSTILLVMGKTLLGVWMGPAYAARSYLILVVLLVPQIYSLSQFTTEEVLLGTGRHKLYSFVVVAEAISNLTLSIILIKPYGILGVALGTSLPIILFRVLLSPIFVVRIRGTSFLRYLKESLLLPLAISIPVGIVAIGLELFLRAESLLEFSLQAILLLLIYYLLAWMLVVEEPVKQSVLDRIRNLTGLEL